jgi:hypothetical protein
VHRLEIADDDDCWEPNHIAACLQALQQQQQQQQQQQTMSISGIIRHTTPSLPQPAITPGTGTKQSLPAAGPLTAAQFLIGNPHIQGSNLFVRLDKLLQAGGFNEWLPSTTDRDLCIRLAGVGVAAAVTQQHTVHHFAPAPAAAAAAGESNSAGASSQSAAAAAVTRLSEPASAAKAAGLHRFYHDMWGPHMTAAQQETACRRAVQLFGVDLRSSSSCSSSVACGVAAREREPLSITAASTAAAATDQLAEADHTSSSSSSSSISATTQPLVLVVGVVSSSEAVVGGLLSDLLLLQQGAAAGLLGGMEVLLMENANSAGELSGRRWHAYIEITVPQRLMHGVVG